MNTRWASWRRDLLFALAGAVVASAAIVPVGWWQVRAERQRAEAAEAQREALEHRLQERGGEQAERAAAEQAMAERDLDEKYRLLLQQFELSDTTADIGPRPKTVELGSQPKTFLTDEGVRKVLEAERRERTPK